MLEVQCFLFSYYEILILPKIICSMLFGSYCSYIELFVLVGEKCEVKIGFSACWVKFFLHRVVHVHFYGLILYIERET